MPRDYTLSNVVLLLAGGASALAFAPLDLWPLAFLAMTLLVHRIAHASSVRRAFWHGWFFGAGHFIVGLNWIAIAFTYQSKMPAWLGWIAVVLLSLYLALFPALASMLAWRMSRRHQLGFVFVFAATWMLSEWLRATLFTGFAWNPLGVVWLPLPWVAQAGMWIGTYGLSGLAVLAAGLLWIGLQRRWLAALAISFGLAGAFLLLGRTIADAREMSGPSGTPVRIVQPNIGQDEKYDPAQAERHERIYAKLSGEPASHPRVLLWPEAATLRYLDLEPEARANLGALLGPHDLLILGGQSVALGVRGSEDVYHNSVFALDSSGTLRWRYDKAHLVPFGEYLPARGVLGRIGISRLVPGDGDFTPGPGPRTLPLPGFSSGDGAPASVGVQLCYEIIFSGHVIDRANRPTFLFNPSNDAWFGPWGPPQHLAQARLRAVEEGIPVIRATPDGISAVIDPKGRLLATLPRHEAGVIDMTVPDPLPPTVFARFGLWASALFGAVLAIIGVAAGRIGPHTLRRE